MRESRHRSAALLREHDLDLGPRGRAWVWEWPGPAGAPALVLVHGVALDAESNWFPVLPALAAHFRLIVPDLRGHGRGPDHRGGWQVGDYADDVAAVVEAFDVGPVVAAGYSMGGMVVQELWHRHPDLVAGLALCATARNMAGTPAEALVGLATPWILPVARIMPGLRAIGSDALAGPLLDARMDPATRGAALARLRRTPLVVTLEAMLAANRFTSHRWIGTVDVPTAVLLTEHDRVVLPARQRKLAAAIPDCRIVAVPGDHGVFLGDPATFGRGLLEACCLAARLPSPTSTNAA